MKATIIAIFLGIPLATGVAYGDEVHLVRDPSGAPMCFDQSSSLVPLARCDALIEADSYQVRRDPSGAPMCFAADGTLAPLARCATKLPPGDGYAFYEVIRDPSGAPMCSGPGGKLAPLSRCDNPYHQTVVAGDLLTSPRPTALAQR